MKRLFMLTVLSLMLAGMTLTGAPVSQAATGNVVWNTFYGGTGEDVAFGIAHDSAGNIYVTGTSFAAWGTPIESFEGDWDAFVARLTPDGDLVWHTFLGGSYSDGGGGIAVDGNANVLVTGYSSKTWGMPVNAHSGGNDAFVAKLNSNGKLLWNTFVGGSEGSDAGTSIALDQKGRPYIAGWSTHSWGTPVLPFAGGSDAFVARLSPNGILNWNTFLGGAKIDEASDIVVDAGGAAYVTGWSESAWGTPLRGYSGGDDAFIAKVGAHGVRKWNTFLGGGATDRGGGIALDNNGMVYSTGQLGGVGPFLVKLGQDGVIRWNKNFGSGLIATAPKDLILDSARNIYVGGDRFVAELNPKGELKWSTGLDKDVVTIVFGITMDANSKLYLAGFSDQTWGTPKHPYTDGGDAFVAKIQ